jgi:uncharacterized protein (DUF4415 family)
MRKHYDFSKGRRGAIDPLPPGKVRITIRLDEAVIRWFKDKVNRAGGGNYQTLINAALREHIRRTDEPLEATLRRVLREELRRKPR